MALYSVGLRIRDVQPEGGLGLRGRADKGLPHLALPDPPRHPQGTSLNTNLPIVLLLVEAKARVNGAPSVVDSAPCPG